MKTTEKILSAVLFAGGAVVIVLSLIWTINKGLNKQEIVECKQWLDQSKTYIGWYSTDWQRQQCSALGITLPKETADKWSEFEQWEK